MGLSWFQVNKTPPKIFVNKKEKAKMTIKLDKEYEVKTTLGTIREIERVFSKSFFDIISNVANLKIEEQIKLLFIGVKKANPDLNEKTFNDLFDDHVGLGDLMDYLEKFIFALQYPGLTEHEVQEKIEKKLKRTQALQKSKTS